MKKILLISNMYPSSKYPNYGIFVKNSEDILNKEYIIKKVVLTKTKFKITKIFKYIVFYCSAIFQGIFRKNDYIYGHYVSHIAIPILIIKFLKPQSKIILNVHGNDIIPESKKDQLMIKFSDRVLKKADYVISPSYYFKNVLINNYHISKNKIIVFASGGVDDSIFEKYNNDLAKSKLGLIDNYLYVGYVSRITKDKGWDIFIKAIKIIKEKFPERKIKYLIIGDGNEYEKMKKFIYQLDLNNEITLFNNIKHNELQLYYNAMDLFVFPTYRKSESLGLVGLEAMSCGRLVLATNNYGPTSYIIDGKNGFLFKEKDYVDLANKIIKILDLPKSSKEKIINNAILTANKYSTSNISKELIKIFEKDLEGENNE